MIGGEHNALGVIRNLGRLGIPVYCVVDTPPDYARYSTYCRGSVRIPGAESRSAVLQRFLASKEPADPPVYLHPTSDLSVLTVSQIQEDLEGYVAMVPSHAIAQTVILKQRFYRSLAAYGIPHPETLTIASRDRRVPELPFTYPVYVKPSLSQAFEQRFHRKGFLARNPTALQHYLTLAQQHSLDVVVQEVIPGAPTQGYIIRGYMTRQSRLRFLFVSQKLRQPQLFSIESAQVSVPLATVAACSQRIIAYLTHLRYRGLFHVEIKFDARDHVFKVLDMNARSGGGNSHPDACGANHILLSYLEAVGEDVPLISTYHAGIYSTYCLLDLLSLYAMRKNRTLALTPTLRSYLRTRDWILARDDLRPFLREVSAIIPHAGTLLRRGLSSIKLANGR